MMLSVLPSLLAVVGAILSLCIGSPEIGSLQADAILPNHLGKFNFEELEKSIYSVVLSAAPVAAAEEEQKEETVSVGDTPGESKTATKSKNLLMVSSRGQKFACLVPDVREVNSPSAKDGQEHTVKKFPNVSEILSALAERACLIKTVGWWTYEYCHGTFMRQYHVEAGVPVGNTFYLGYYSNETVWTEDQIQLVNASKRKLRSGEVNPHAFHSVYYDNGTECDVSKKPRKTRVKVTCGVSGMDTLADIQEVDTCSYVVHIHTPLLCDVPYFRREQLEEVHIIKCSPLVSREKYDAFHLEQKKQTEIEAKNRADQERNSESGQLQLSSVEKTSSESKKRTYPAVDVTGDTDERTVLLYDLVAAMAPGVLSDEQIQEELEILRWKFRGLQNNHLKLLLQKVEQEREAVGEKEGVSEEAVSTKVEGVVKVSDDEEQEALAELEMDDESLSTLEDAVTSEVKEKLAELGLPTDGLEVKLKVTSLELDDETEEELNADPEASDNDGSGATGEVTVSKKKKKKEVKVIKLTLFSDALGSIDSQTRTKEAEAKEKAKMSYLEQAYNLVWDKKSRRRKKQSQV